MWVDKFPNNKNIKSMDYENGLLMYVVGKSVIGSYYIPLEVVLKTLEQSKKEK